MKEQLIARIKAAADDATHQQVWNEGPPYRKNFFHPSEYKKRSEYLLSTMLNEGVDSSFIWASFLQIPLAEQQLYLNRNPELKRYKRLHDLLNNQNAADPRNRPQIALVNFIDQHPTFVANQLQFDADLRRQFFFLLTHANPTEFKPLLKLVTKTPALATEFENTVTQELNPTEDKKDLILESMHLGQGKPPEDPVFKDFKEKMGRSLLVRDEILTAVLTAGKEKFSSEFIAEVALHRQGNIEQYRSKLNSKLWRAGNFIKLWLLPSIIAQFFEPPITKETVEKISTIISKLDEMAAQDPAPAEDEIPLTVFHPNDKIRFTGFRRLLQPVDPNNEHSVVPSDAEDHTTEEDERDIAAAGQQQAQQDATGAEDLAVPADAVDHAIPPFQPEQNDPTRAKLAVHATAGALPPIAYPPAVPTQPGKSVNEETVSASPSSYVSLNDVLKQGRKEARKQERAAKKKNAPLVSPAAPEDNPDENSQTDASFLADLFGTRSQHNLGLATVVSRKTSSKILNAASSPKIRSASNIVAQVTTPSTPATLVQADDKRADSGSEEDLKDTSLNDASFLADLFATRTQKEVKPAKPRDRLFDFGSEEDLSDNSTDLASLLADLLAPVGQNGPNTPALDSIPATPVRSEPNTVTLVVPVSPAAPSVSPSIQPGLTAEENQSDGSETEERLPAGLFDSPISVIHKTPVDSTLATPIKFAKTPSTVPSPQTSSEVAALPEAAIHSTPKVATPSTSISVVSEVMAPVNPVPSPLKAESVVHSPAVRSAVKPPVDAVASPLKAVSVTHSPAATPVRSELETVGNAVLVSHPAVPVSPSVQLANLTAEGNQSDGSETEEHSLRGLLSSVIFDPETTPTVSPYTTPVKSVTQAALAVKATPKAGLSTPKVDTTRPSPAVKSTKVHSVTPSPMSTPKQGLGTSVQVAQKPSDGQTDTGSFGMSPNTSLFFSPVLPPVGSRSVRKNDLRVQSQVASVAHNESEAAPLSLHESEAVEVALSGSEAASLNGSEAVSVALTSPGTPANQVGSSSFHAQVTPNDYSSSSFALSDKKITPGSEAQTYTGKFQAASEPLNESEAASVILDDSDAESVDLNESEAAPVDLSGAESEAEPVDLGGAESEAEPVDLGGAESEAEPVDLSGAESEAEPLDLGGAESEAEPLDGEDLYHRPAFGGIN